MWTVSSAKQNVYKHFSVYFSISQISYSLMNGNVIHSAGLCLTSNSWQLQETSFLFIPSHPLLPLARHPSSPFADHNAEHLTKIRIRQWRLFSLRSFCKRNKSNRNWLIGWWRDRFFFTTIFISVRPSIAAIRLTLCNAIAMYSSSSSTKNFSRSDRDSGRDSEIKEKQSELCVPLCAVCLPMWMFAYEWYYKWLGRPTYVRPFFFFYFFSALTVRAPSLTLLFVIV